MQSQLEKTESSTGALYEEDFFEWTRRNAELLRAGCFDEVDIKHITEEIEDMGKRDLRALDSRLEVLLAHLLKLKFQLEKRSSSWLDTVDVQRVSVERLLMRYPSLRGRIEPNLAANYRFALSRAVRETGLPKGAFPAECPFTVDQILDPEFLP
jgi:Domain of unknown function DUF29